MVGVSADARTKIAKRWQMVEEEGRLPEEVPTLLFLKSGDRLTDPAADNQLPPERKSGVCL